MLLSSYWDFGCLPEFCWEILCRVIIEHYTRQNRVYTIIVFTLSDPSKKRTSHRRRNHGG